MVPSMLESIFFYILQKIILDYDSHFLCVRVTVFSGTRQQNFAGAGLLYTEVEGIAGLAPHFFSFLAPSITHFSLIKMN
jgi:hypothetical protein